MKHQKEWRTCDRCGKEMTFYNEKYAHVKTEELEPLYDKAMYTAEDLAKDPSEYPPTVMTPLSLSTTTTSCLFTNVEKGYDLTMRVRSVLANGRKSLWSLPINVTVSTEINSVDSDNIPSADTSNTIYDLSGRPVSSLSRSGIYIRNGKKIVVSNGK